MPTGDAWKWIGIDETNHGRRPEIFVGVYSKIESDAFCHQEAIYPKIHGDDPHIGGKIAHRDYRFVIVNQEFDNYREHEIFGAVVTSFIYEIANSDDGIALPFTVFADGILPHKKIEEVYRQCQTNIRISPKNLELRTGKDLDKRNMLVNLADEIAFKLYHTSMKNLATHERKIDLILPASSNYRKRRW